MIEMSDDAWIEQRCRFERILVHEIGAQQPTLLFCESRVGGDGFFHFIGASLECLEQIAMTSLKVLEDFGEFAGGCFGIKRQDAIDDVIGTRLVGGVEVPRFCRRLERSDDHSCRIRAQIQTLPVKWVGSDKISSSDCAKSNGIQARKARSGAGFVRLLTMRANWRISARLRR